VLRTDGHRLAALTPDSEPTKILRALSRTRKDLVEARVALVNQLTSQLEGCFPGAIGLFHELHSPTAVAFLRRSPTSHAAATLTQATLAALLRRLHYSGRTPVSELLRRLQTAPAAGISPAEAAGRAVCVLALLDAIQVTSRQERELEAEIIERLEVHADQHIFTSLPRAGHGVRAAALLAELGDVRARFPTEEALAAQGGAAPVTITSGKRRVVKFRWACDKKLRAALLDFADDSRHASPWAATIYAEAIQRTRHHPTPCASWPAPGSG
jgi:transposase